MSTMSRDRWNLLMNNDDEKLTEEEIKAGWHFCWEWDGLLIGPGMDETQCCTSNCGSVVYEHQRPNP